MTSTTSKTETKPSLQHQIYSSLVVHHTQNLLPYWTQDAVLVNKTILVCRHLCVWADSVDWCCRWRSNDDHSRNTCRAWRCGACALSCQSNCKTINTCRAWRYGACALSCQSNYKTINRCQMKKWNKMQVFSCYTQVFNHGKYSSINCMRALTTNRRCSRRFFIVFVVNEQ